MLYSFHYDMRQPEHDLGKPALARPRGPLLRDSDKPARWIGVDRYKRVYGDQSRHLTLVRLDGHSLYYALAKGYAHDVPQFESPGPKQVPILLCCSFLS